MPPFQYTPFVDPYVGSIAQLMGQRGQREADAAEQIAAIRAQEAIQRGQISGGVIQGIGETIGRLPADYQEAKDRKFQEDQRKRLLEEQGRADDARTLWGGMQDVETLPSRQGIPTIETTLPARFGYPDANDGFTEVDVPSETHRGFKMISRPGETTNPYKELDKDGIQALDLWDINAVEKAFAEQGLGIEGQQYIKWMEESNTRMKEHHANAMMMAGDSANKIIGLSSYAEMLNATETLLEKFGNNGVFSARDLGSFGSSLATIKGMPEDQQESALKGLLVQMIPGGEETIILGPGDEAVGALSGRTVAEGQPRPENLTSEEQALDAFARSLGLRSRLDLSHEQRNAFAKQSAANIRAPQAPPVVSRSWFTNPETDEEVYLTDDEAIAMGAGRSPTADMRNKTEGRRLVKGSIDAIEELSRSIITKVGPQQRLDAIRRGVEAVWGTDPEFRTYMDARRALAGNLAVAQQGSRPSDADITAVWLPLVPNAYTDTAESADLKWKLIYQMSNVEMDRDEDETPLDPNPIPADSPTNNPNDPLGLQLEGS
jgi:hypothetical protein